MQLAGRRRQAVYAVLAALVLAVWWLSQHGTTSDSPDRTGQTDPVSGLRWVDLDDLPAEAAETVRLIDDGGPFPYDRDGIAFGNREGILPDQRRGYYREYTVPTPGEDDRGARRVVTGAPGEYYWTEDHYDSFERIAR
jgi:ribonuclease T1